LKATGRHGGQKVTHALKSEAIVRFRERKITHARKGAKRLKEIAGKRSPLARKSEATELSKKGKVTHVEKGKHI
jgi:hypothetical protein